MKEGLIYVRVDFGVLRNIIRDRNNKQKAATDSAECLREFLNLDTNLIEENRSMKQDEAANFIMSMQNWLLRRGFSTTKETVAVGDIFYADLGINYKPEFSYHHPVIILEKIGGMYMVVPVSTTPDNISQAYHPVDNTNGSKMMRKVYGNDTGSQSDGFEKTGAVLLTDVKVISEGRLISKKGQLKDISNEGSLFREIKESVFKFCFPKVNIRLYKSEKELKELKEKYTQLETAYNELKNSIEVKDSE